MKRGDLVTVTTVRPNHGWLLVVADETHLMPVGQYGAARRIGWISEKYVHVCEPVPLADQMQADAARVEVVQEVLEKLKSLAEKMSGFAKEPTRETFELVFDLIKGLGKVSLKYHGKGSS